MTRSILVEILKSSFNFCSWTVVLDSKKFINQLRWHLIIANNLFEIGLLTLRSSTSFPNYNTSFIVSELIRWIISITVRRLEPSRSHRKHVFFPSNSNVSTCTDSTSLSTLASLIISYLIRWINSLLWLVHRLLLLSSWWILLLILHIVHWFLLLLHLKILGSIKWWVTIHLITIKIVNIKLLKFFIFYKNLLVLVEIIS